MTTTRKALTERQAQAAIKKAQSAVIVWARIVGLATITNDASVDLPAARAQLLAAAVNLSHADITLRAVTVGRVTPLTDPAR
jgi:hypothetical protein